MTSSPPLDYADVPGRLIGAMPYRSDGAILFGAFLKGDRDAQQTLCDRMLNAPSKNAMRFIAVSDYVLYAALSAARTYSLDPRDHGRGAMRERDIGFWSLVLGGRAQAPLSWRLYWLPVFLFVDSASAMASGREIYGYGKDIGAFDLSGAPDTDPCVAVTVEHLEKFGKDETAERAVLFALERPQPPAPETLFGSFATAARTIPDLFDAAPAAFAALAREPSPEFSEKAAKLGANLAGGGLFNSFGPPRMGLPTILLKQSPAANAPLKAVHQAIVSVEPTADRVNAMSTLPGRYVVRIARSESHPIARTLGLPALCDAHWVFRVAMDFTVPHGKVLWRSP